MSAAQALATADWAKAECGMSKAAPSAVMQVIALMSGVLPKNARARAHLGRRHNRVIAAIGKSELTNINQARRTTDGSGDPEDPSAVEGAERKCAGGRLAKRA